MSHAPTDALRRRHQLVREAAAAERLDAVVVTSLPNILYLSNFGGSSAVVVLTADRFYFVTDFRYVTAAGEMGGGPCACPGLELVTVDGSYDATLATLLGSLAAARIGFEAAHLTVSRHRWLGAPLQDGGAARAERGLAACAAGRANIDRRRPGRAGLRRRVRLILRRHDPYGLDRRGEPPGARRSPGGARCARPRDCRGGAGPVAICDRPSGP